MPTLPNPAPLAGAALRCQSDSRLTALSREGQARAFEEIVRRYRDRLVAFAGSIVPAHRAEDVVQEALARAHAALMAGDSEITLKPWLYTIVRNRALNDLRDEPIHEHLDESFDGVPQPPEVAARREQLAALFAQLGSLPPAQRDALVQRELEGRSHDEIAADLGATPGAVRGLIYRARTALRDGAGMLIPLPALRALLNAGPLQPESAGTGISGTAVVGLATGGGGGIAVKGATTLAIAVLAVGSGIALDEPGGEQGSKAAAATHRGASRSDRRGADSSSPDPSRGSNRGEAGSRPDAGGSRSGDGAGDASSGPGSGGDVHQSGGESDEGGSGGGDRSGSGDGGGSAEHETSSGPDDGAHEGSSGPGHGDQGGVTGGEHEGSGGGGGDDGPSSGGGSGETGGDATGGDGATGDGAIEPHDGGGDISQPADDQPDD